MGNDSNAGSLALGLLIGFFCGCFGLGAVFLFGEEQTKRGAMYGFMVQFAIGAVAGAIYKLA